MDREIIEQKIESLRRCVERVHQKSPATAATLTSDPDAQDILTLNLTRAVQLCVDIGAHLIAVQGKPAPDTMGQTFDVLSDLGVINPGACLAHEKGCRVPQHRGAQLQGHRLADRAHHRHASCE